MKSLLILVAGIASNLFYVPNEYRGGNAAMVYFVNQKGIDHFCGKMTGGYYTVACSFKDKDLMYLPNPCQDKDANNPDSYAHTACHELAHLNGWHHIGE